MEVAPAMAASRHRTSTLLRELVETGLLAILVFLSVRASVQHYRVEGLSMDPTLEDGEFLLVNSLVYSEVDLEKVGKWVPFWDPGEPGVRHVFHGPERGDIVILHQRVGVERDLVKRIIGIPEKDIVGKAMASWWPRSAWGLAPNEEPVLGAAP
ncbi:signal peptidase I [Candidatus Amarobacter glycogenicus]|uniref:signal peptidase I n=1 Tax=Candidatus Amarobacter glycogenicus TaxID=3140699 RepID=UPI0031CC827F